MPALLALNGEFEGQQVLLEDSYDITVGRGDQNLLAIKDDEMISGSHCVFRKIGENWTIEDLDSTNGTLLNNAPVTKSPLIDHDVVTIGNTQFRYVEKTGHTQSIAKAPLPPLAKTQPINHDMAIDVSPGLLKKKKAPPPKPKPAPAPSKPAEQKAPAPPAPPQPPPAASPPPPANPISQDTYFDDVLAGRGAQEEEPEDEKEGSQNLDDWLKNPSTTNTLLAMSAIGILFVVMLMFFIRVV